MSQRHTLVAMIFGRFFCAHIHNACVMRIFVSLFSHANSWVLGGQISKFTTLKIIQIILIARDLSKSKINIHYYDIKVVIFVARLTNANANMFTL